MLDRIKRGFKRRGFRETTREAGRRTLARVYANESHMWYALDLERVEPQALAEGYELVRATTSEQVEMIGQIEATPIDESKRRVDAGSDLWLSHADGDVGFACFVFFDSVPLIAAPRGLRLADGICCLENSFANPDHRRKNLAASTWTLICDPLAKAGNDVMITPVAMDNRPARGAVEKAGFIGAAVMDYRRRGGSVSVTLTPEGKELTAAEARAAKELEAELSR